MIFRGPTYLEVKTFVQETSNAEDVHRRITVKEFPSSMKDAG